MTWSEGDENRGIPRRLAGGLFHSAIGRRYSVGMRTHSPVLLSSVLLSLSVVMSGCGSSSDSEGPLTPARSIVGTWKASAPSTVKFDTDFCTADLSLVASQGWTITLDIRAGANENSVDAAMSFVTSGAEIISGCPGTGVVPEVSPLLLTGNVSGTRLELRTGTTPVAKFNFTTDIMTGYLDYSWCSAYCQREYTDANAIVLRRQ